MITLATLQDATQQQIFDQVSAHLLKQNQQCKSDIGGSNQCAYRGGENDGLKCAAGCLIADGEYKPEMDRAGYVNSTHHGSDWISLIKRGLVPETPHTNLILELQHLHDSTEVDSWKSRLQDLAVSYGLVLNV